MAIKLQNLLNKLHEQIADESGQGLSEYVLIIFLFAVAMVLSFSGFASALMNFYTTIQSAF